MHIATVILEHDTLTYAAPSLADLYRQLEEFPSNHPEQAGDEDRLEAAAPDDHRERVHAYFDEKPDARLILSQPQRPLTIQWALVNHRHGSLVFAALSDEDLERKLMAWCLDNKDMAKETFDEHCEPEDFFAESEECYLEYGSEPVEGEAE